MSVTWVGLWSSWHCNRKLFTFNRNVLEPNKKKRGHNRCDHNTGQEVYKKVKCILVQALRLCAGRTTHSGSRGITVLFLDHGTRRRWGVNVMPRPFYTPGKDPVPILQEAGWTPRPVWTGAENLAPHRDSIPDRPARSQSLYGLSYPADPRSLWQQ